MMLNSLFKRIAGSTAGMLLVIGCVAQSYNIATYNGTTVNTCSGNFYDSGGSGGNYGNNENYVVTFCSTSGSPLYFDFTPNYNLDAGTGDTLFFYDGLTTADPLIAILVKNDDYGFGYPVVGTTSTCVTVQFKSNASANDGGWQASISCEEPPVCDDNPPAADIFGQATAVCNLNDYCGTTSGYYGEDAPYNFGGTGGDCPSPDDGLFAGTLENNSWLKFVASATTANFDFNVTGGGSCDGIQVGIFGFNTTTKTFSRKTPCNYTDGGWEGAFTLSATGLTIGETYYMMIDGNAGSNCDYTIGAGTGVAVVNAGADQLLCSTSATISATGATGSGEWTLITGGGTITDPYSATTTVTGLPYGINTFRWTVTGGLCADADIFDEVIIDISCLLPITLSEFSGIAQQQTVALHWTTAEELNAAQFIVERSPDAHLFTPIGSVSAAGTTSTPQQYTFIDDAPLSLNYYRLKQEDADGQFSYSEVIAVSNEHAVTTGQLIEAYYDPESQAVVMEYFAVQQGIIQVLCSDIQGRVVLSQSVPVSPGMQTIRMDAFPPSGVIIMQVAGDTDRSTLKFVVH